MIHATSRPKNPVKWLSGWPANSVALVFGYPDDFVRAKVHARWRNESYRPFTRRTWPRRFEGKIAERTHGGDGDFGFEKVRKTVGSRICHYRHHPGRYTPIRRNSLGRQCGQWRDQHPNQKRPRHAGLLVLWRRRDGTTGVWRRAIWRSTGHERLLPDLCKVF